MKNDEPIASLNTATPGVHQNPPTFAADMRGRDTLHNGASAGSAPKAQETPDPGPDLFHRRLAYSVKETADILGVSTKTVRRLIDRKLLRVSRALRHLLIPKKEIERFLNDTLIE